MKQHVLSLIICLALLVWYVGPALAQVRTMSTEELTGESSAVLTGICESSRSFWTEGHDKIFTEVRIRVSEYAKGNLGAEAVITVPGGRVGNTIYEVTDMPLFGAGEEVVLFVWRHPSGINLVTGAGQGKILIEKDRITGKKTVRMPTRIVETETQVGFDALPPHTSTKQVPLDEYLKEVRKFTKP